MRCPSCDHDNRYDAALHRLRAEILLAMDGPALRLVPEGFTTRDLIEAKAVLEDLRD